MESGTVAKSTESNGVSAPPVDAVEVHNPATGELIRTVPIDSPEVVAEKVARVRANQSEWEAMRRVEPGRYTLVREGIATEGEAERVARESPGGTATQQVTRLKARPR